MTLQHDTQQEKGPAEAATSPSHGPINPAKDIDMNTTENSTAAAARQEKDRRIVDSMHVIEGDLHSLVNMAAIMADLLDSELRSVGTKDGVVTIKIGYQHLNMCCFAWNDVTIRANAFKERFNAALKGEVAA